MKKLISLLVASIFIITPFFAQEDDDWKTQGKKALEETGSFLKKTGEKVKESYDSASEVTCYGKWVFENDDVQITLDIKKDGTIGFYRKIGMETDYWLGTFKSNLKMLTFKIDEAGRKGLISDKKVSKPEQTWRFTYSLQDDKKHLKVYSSDIPSGIDATDFGKGVLFTKK